MFACLELLELHSSCIITSQDYFAIDQEARQFRKLHNLGRGILIFNKCGRVIADVIAYAKF